MQAIKLNFLLQIKELALQFINQFLVYFVFLNDFSNRSLLPALFLFFYTHKEKIKYGNKQLYRSSRKHHLHNMKEPYK